MRESELALDSNAEVLLYLPKGVQQIIELCDQIHDPNIFSVHLFWNDKTQFLPYAGLSQQTFLFVADFCFSATNN